MVARLQADKGQPRFLRALADLRRSGLAIHGLLVGGDTYDFSPGYEAQLRNLLADLDLSDHVTMTGHVADVEPYIRAMDISVNASDQETFGVALLESMALGVPPVAPVNAGSTEYIEQERSGLLVPPRDHRSLANVLERLVRDPGLRRRLGEEARRSVERQFTAEAMTEALQSRLEQLARESL
jgi:D-inositol-3-phosphate glycosyltransferase